MPDHGEQRTDPTVAEDPNGPAALDGLRFAVAGPGRVGGSLARWAVDRGAELALIVQRRPHVERRHGLAGQTSSTRVISFDQLASPATATTETMASVDLLLLTVSDDALVTVAEDCARHWERQKPTFAVVLHSSGCFDAEVLAPLRQVGVAVGSLHPLRAFTGEIEGPGSQAYFAVDGDAPALALARRLVAAWGGTCCELSGDRRVAYHLAASLAAGGVVTVLAAVTQLMRDADLPDQLLAGYLRLLEGAVESATAGGPRGVAAAITGPAARGDSATLERHLAALRAKSPSLEPLVRALWTETRRQSGRDRDSGPTGAENAPFVVDRP